MLRLSQYSGNGSKASFYDVRSLVNVNELRHDFHRLQKASKPARVQYTQHSQMQVAPQHAVYTDTVTYQISRLRGSLRQVDGSFRSLSQHQFHVVIGLYMKAFYGDVDEIDNGNGNSNVDEVNIAIEARRIQGGAEHPGMPLWEVGENTNTSILCVRHENIDGGCLEVQGIDQVIRKELSPAYLVNIENANFRFAPTMSFDGTRESFQDVYIVRGI